MKRAEFLLTAAAAAILSVMVSLLQGQAQSISLEQQLSEQYRIASVGSNGAVFRTGSVVVIQQDGITALQVSPRIAPGSSSWPNTYKKGGRIGTPILQRINYSPLKKWSRPLQVGEKAYIISIQVRSSDIVFGLQTCPADANETPYRASLTFQFQEGVLTSENFKQVQEVINDVFSIETSIPSQVSEGAQAPMPTQPISAQAAPPGALNLPCTYVSAQAPTDQLQLNADNTLALQEGGQTYHGTFKTNGNTLELNIDPDIKTTVTIDGDHLRDASGQTWILQEQATPSGTPEKVTTETELEKLGALPVASDEQFKFFIEGEKARIRDRGPSDNASKISKLRKEATEANRSHRWQEVIDAYQKILAIDPEDWSAFLMLANSYNGVGSPDKSLEYALKALEKVRYKVLFAIVAEAYGKKGNKDKALLWLERALRGGFTMGAENFFKNSPQYSNDPEYNALLRKYGIVSTSSPIQKDSKSSASATAVPTQPPSAISSPSEPSEKVSEPEPRIVYVKWPTATLREGPGRNFKAVIEVKKGTSLIVLDDKDQWLLVGLEDGTEGWIGRGTISEAP